MRKHTMLIFKNKGIDDPRYNPNGWSAKYLDNLDNSFFYKKTFTSPAYPLLRVFYHIKRLNAMKRKIYD